MPRPRELVAPLSLVLTADLAAALDRAVERERASRPGFAVSRASVVQAPLAHAFLRRPIAPSNADGTLGNRSQSSHSSAIREA